MLESEHTDDPPKLASLRLEAVFYSDRLAIDEVSSGDWQITDMITLERGRLLARHLELIFDDDNATAALVGVGMDDSVISTDVDDIFKNILYETVDGVSYIVTGQPDGSMKKLNLDVMRAKHTEIDIQLRVSGLDSGACKCFIMHVARGSQQHVFWGFTLYMLCLD